MSLLALAGWCRYLQGTDDAGAPIDHSSDPYMAEARECAMAAVDDPAAFLSFSEVFGDLVNDDQVRTDFTTALKSLRDHRVRQTLDMMLDTGSVLIAVR